MPGIPIYKEINDIHELTGSLLRTKNPYFHCFDMAQANDLTVMALPPHRADFYMLALNFGTKNLEYTLNNQVFKNPDQFMLCVAPGQVATWEKNGQWLGYCTFFKSEFLHFSAQINFLQQYPFFKMNETNLLPVEEDDFKMFSFYFRQIIAEQAAESPFSYEIIRSAFQVVLWQTRRIYEKITPTTSSQKAGDLIVAQFHFFVNEYFLQKTRVEEYALLLNISANHLSQTVSERTGKTAKNIITKRRLEEAKYLLLYTTSDIAEIAYQLNFTEPTHFTKFFKKETSFTPLEYRLSNR